MGVSNQLNNLPVPSGAVPAAVEVDLRDGPATDSETSNTSATTSAGKVVGESITEPDDIELRGLKLIAGSPTFS